MKNLLGLIVIILVLTGCTKRNQDGAVLLKARNDVADSPYIEVIDSCEYVVWGYKMAHKGNCRFCAARRDTQSAIIIESYYGEDEEY